MLSIVEKIGNKITRYQDERRRRALPQPSYFAKMAERKRLAEQVRTLRGAISIDSPIYPMETKIGQKEIAKKAGIKFAAIIQGPFDSVSQFDLDSLPHRFVIKPIVGSGANGVFLLEKKNDGLIDALSGRTYPANLTSLLDAGLSKFEGCPLIAEELIDFAGRPSMNWKAFCFFGEVAFFREGDPSQSDKPYKLISPDGNDLGPIDNLGFRYDSKLPLPNDLSSLVAAAQKVSMFIMTPFVRVDLYESDDGVSLGEITLRPSSLWKKKHLQRFTPEWDRRLGQMWEDAQARLIEKVGESYIP
jgi:hypothetical protein